MKILITGGHVTPALAVIDEILSQKGASNSVVFVGRKYVNDREHEPSLEYQEVSKRKILFYDLKTGRLTRVISRSLIKSLFQIPQGFWQAKKIIKKERPDCIMTFGGYLGFPVGLAAWFDHIPLYLHEQTISPGLTNRILGRFAKKIFVSFAETVNFFPRDKTVVTGNPVRSQIFQVLEKPISFVKNRPVVYITGGSLGSHSINILIFAIVPSLTKKYIVIHQTGDVTEYADYEKALTVKKSLPEDLASRYFVTKHFSDSQIGFIYNMADLVVGRSGANTFFELVDLNKPAIFIPLPWSAGREQQKHAAIFVKHQTGELFDQNRQPSELLALIDRVIDKLATYKAHFHSLQTLSYRNAASTIRAYLLSQT